MINELSGTAATSEVADALDADRNAIYKKLRLMEDDEQVVSRTVGASECGQLYMIPSASEPTGTHQPRGELALSINKAAVRGRTDRETKAAPTKNTDSHAAGGVEAEAFVIV